MIYKIFIFVFFGLWAVFDYAIALATEPPPSSRLIRFDSNPGFPHLMTVRAKVQGREGVFLFDTGGGVSMLTPSFAQSIGCTPWGQMTGFRMTGERIDVPRCDHMEINIQGKPFKLASMGVIDLMKFMPQNAPPLDGMLGLDLFADRSITFSLKQKYLILEDPISLSFRVKQAKPILIRLVRDVEGAALTISVAVPTPRGTAWMALDSGNVGRIVVGKHLAPLLNLDPNTKETQPVRFILVGGIPVQGTARILENMIKDGNLGAQFLSEWDLTLDLSRGLAWLAPAHFQ